LMMVRDILSHKNLSDTVTGGPSNFVRQLINNRYSHLFIQFPVLARNGYPPVCMTTVHRYLNHKASPASEAIREMVTAAVRTFTFIPNTARRRVWMWNYIEMIAHATAGLNHVGAFLRCFAENRITYDP